MFFVSSWVFALYLIRIGDGSGVLNPEPERSLLFLRRNLPPCLSLIYRLHFYGESETLDMAESVDPPYSAATSWSPYWRFAVRVSVD